MQSVSSVPSASVATKCCRLDHSKLLAAGVPSTHRRAVRPNAAQGHRQVIGAADGFNTHLQGHRPPSPSTQATVTASAPGLAPAAPATAPTIAAVSGRIHSQESMSAVDGPGLRYMIFEQGCGLRCLFCCNPDTFPCGEGHGTPTSSKELAARISRVAPYLRPSGGGVTCSGGEPLLQPEFTAAIFQEAHALGLTTALDTTGNGNQHMWDTVLPHTDLVLLCLKHPMAEQYRTLTGGHGSYETALRFVEQLHLRKVPFRVRYVLIPGYTDGGDDVDALVDFCLQHRPEFQAVELLPYHLLGKHKWEAMGLAYPLEGVQPPSEERVQQVIGQLEAAGVQVICDAKQ